MGNQSIANSTYPQMCFVEEGCSFSVQPPNNSGFKYEQNIDDFFGKALIMTRQDNQNLVNKRSFQEHGASVFKEPNDIIIDQKQISTIILEKLFINHEELKSALNKAMMFHNIHHKNIVTIRQVESKVIDILKMDKVYIGRAYCDYFPQNLYKVIQERKMTEQAKVQKSNQEISQKSQRQSCSSSYKSILFNQKTTEKKQIMPKQILNSKKNTYLPAFGKKEIWYMIDSLVDGLKFSQERQIIHGDLRPQTVFLTEEGYLKLSIIQCFTEDNSHTNFNIAASEIIKGKSLQQCIIDNHFLLSIEQLIQLNRLCFTNSNLQSAVNINKQIPLKQEFNPYKSQVYSFGILILQIIFCGTIECCQPLKLNSQNTKRKNITSQPQLNRQGSSFQINEKKNSNKSQNAQINYLYMRDELTNHISINFQLIQELLIVVKSKFSQSLFKILNLCLEINEINRPDCIYLYNELKSLDLQTEASMILDESVVIKQPLQVNYQLSMQNRQRAQSNQDGTINSQILNEGVGHQSPEINNNTKFQNNQNKHFKKLSIDIIQCNSSINFLNSDYIQTISNDKKPNQFERSQFSQTARYSDSRIQNLSQKSFLEENIIGQKKEFKNQMQQQKEDIYKIQKKLSAKELCSDHINNTCSINQPELELFSDSQSQNKQFNNKHIKNSKLNNLYQKTHKKAFSLNVSLNKDENSIINRTQITNDKYVQNNTQKSLNITKTQNESNIIIKCNNKQNKDVLRQIDNINSDRFSKNNQFQNKSLFNSSYIQSILSPKKNDTNKVNKEFTFKNICCKSQQNQYIKQTLQDQEFQFQNQLSSINNDTPQQLTAKFNSETSRKNNSESNLENLDMSDDFKHIYGSPKKIVICSSRIQSPINKKSYLKNISNQFKNLSTKYFAQNPQLEDSNIDKASSNNESIRQTLLIDNSSKRVSLNNLNNRTATFNAQKQYISSLLQSNKLNKEKYPIQTETNQNNQYSFKPASDNYESPSHPHNQMQLNKYFLNKKEKPFNLNQINQINDKISCNSQGIQNNNQKENQDEINTQMSQDQSDITNNQIEINDWKDIESSHISGLLQKSFSEERLINQTNHLMISAVTSKQLKKNQNNLNLNDKCIKQPNVNQNKEELIINQLKDQNGLQEQILKIKSYNSLGIINKQVNKNEINKLPINQMKLPEDSSIHKKNQLANYTSQNLTPRNSTQKITTSPHSNLKDQLKQKQQQITTQKENQNILFQNSPRFKYMNLNIK